MSDALMAASKRMRSCSPNGTQWVSTLRAQTYCRSSFNLKTFVLRESACPLSAEAV